MAIAHVRSGSNAIESSAATQTFSIDCTGGDALVVMVGVRSTSITATVTYNGVSMTETVGPATSAVSRGSMFTLLNPASGTNNLVITYSSNGYGPACYSVFSGVDAISTNTASTTDNGSTDVSTTITSATDEWVVSGFFKKNNGTYGLGTGMTSRATHTRDVGAFNDWNSQIATQDGETSTTVQFTSTDSGDYSVVAVALEPAATGTTYDKSATAEMGATAEGSAVKEQVTETDDIKVQHALVTDFGAGEDTQALTWANLGWDAPSDWENGAFLMPTHTVGGTGPSAGTTSNWDSADVGIRYYLTSTGVTLERDTAGLNEDVRVSLTMVEYVGGSGGANEFRVVHKRSSGTAASATIDISADGITDYDDCWVVQNGQYLDNASANDDARLNKFGIDGVAETFTRARGDTTGTVYYAVSIVEGIGSNWTVEQVDHTTSTKGSAETVTLSTATGAWSEKLIFSTFSITDHGLEDVGALAFPDAANTGINFWVLAAADATFEHTAFAVHNANLDVQHEDTIEGSGTNHTGTGAAETVNTTFTATGALDQTTAHGFTTCVGSGTAYPRPHWSTEATSTTNLRWWRARASQNSEWAAQFSDWSGLVTQAAGDTFDKDGIAESAFTAEGVSEHQATSHKDGQATSAFTAEGDAEHQATSDKEATAESSFTAEGVSEHQATYDKDGTAQSAFTAEGDATATFDRDGQAESAFTAEGVSDTFTYYPKDGAAESTFTAEGVAEVSTTYDKDGTAESAFVAEGESELVRTYDADGAAESAFVAEGASAVERNEDGAAESAFTAEGQSAVTYSREATAEMGTLVEGVEAATFDKDGIAESAFTAEGTSDENQTSDVDGTAISAFVAEGESDVYTDTPAEGTAESAFTAEGISDVYTDTPADGAAESVFDASGVSSVIYARDGIAEMGAEAEGATALIYDRDGIAESDFTAEGTVDETTPVDRDGSAESAFVASGVSSVIYSRDGVAEMGAAAEGTSDENQTFDKDGAAVMALSALDVTANTFDRDVLVALTMRAIAPPAHNRSPSASPDAITAAARGASGAASGSTRGSAGSPSSTTRGAAGSPAGATRGTEGSPSSGTRGTSA